jgi:hypothetical protein
MEFSFAGAKHNCYGSKQKILKQFSILKCFHVRIKIKQKGATHGTQPKVA